MLTKEKVRSHGPVFAAYAGFISRLMAMVVDLLTIAVLWIVGGIAARFVSETSGLGQIIEFFNSRLDWVTPLLQFLVSTAFEVTTLLVLAFCYFAFFYTFGGATPGKLLMGLRVVGSNGRPLSGAQAALRVLAYAASSLPLYMGFISVLMDDRRRAWHDKIARTAVIHSWQARADESFLRTAIERVNTRPESQRPGGEPGSTDL